MKLYQLKVTIVGLPKVYRLIEVSENCTFDNLHDLIFEAFDRYDEHLYSFFLTGKETKNIRKIYQSPEITHPQNLEDFMGFGAKKRSTVKTKMGDVGLKEKDVFHYLFDFGDEWWHCLKVEAVTETTGKKKHLKIVKIVGESPPQYDDEFDDDDDFE